MSHLTSAQASPSSHLLRPVSPHGRASWSQIWSRHRQPETSGPACGESHRPHGVPSRCCPAPLADLRCAFELSIVEHLAWVAALGRTRNRSGGLAGLARFVTVRDGGVTARCRRAMEAVARCRIPESRQVKPWQPGLLSPHSRSAHRQAHRLVWLRQLSLAGLPKPPAICRPRCPQDGCLDIRWRPVRPVTDPARYALSSMTPLLPRSRSATR